jgi:hypothetical protein
MVAGSISSSINFPLISDGNRRKVTFCQIKSLLSQLEEISGDHAEWKSAN